MKKSYFFIPILTLALLGSACQPETTTFDNTTNNNSSQESLSMEDSSTENLPKSDKVGQKISITPPSDLLTKRVETNSSSKVGPKAVFKTTFGDITLQLFEEATPKTVENFISLAEQDYYDGTIFHRVIPDFMIQGGDSLTREQRDNRSIHGTGGPGYQFADEISNHKNVRGAISMANSGADTNGGQFFLITVSATPWLDGKHAVFGEVVEGMDVVDKIEAVSTNGSNHPLEDVEIIDVVILR